MNYVFIGVEYECVLAIEKDQIKDIVAFICATHIPSCGFLLSVDFMRIQHETPPQKALNILAVCKYSIYINTSCLLNV